MYRDLIRTLRQVTDGRFARVLLLSLVLAALLFAALLAGVAWVLTTVALFDTGWLDTIVDLLGVIAFGVIAILLFPAFALAIQGLFLDRVAEAVEARWYPDLPAPRRQPWREVATSTLELAAVVLAVNAVLLPVYLALIFVPPLNFVLFYVVNGFLLGREYFETVALRRLEPVAAKRARRRIRGHVWLAGALIAFMFSIPFLNLAAPVLGTAVMLHLFQRLRGDLGEDDDGVPAGAGQDGAGQDGKGQDGGRRRRIRAGVAGLLFCGVGVAVAVGGGGWQAWRDRADVSLPRPEPPPIRATGLPQDLEGRGQFEVWTRLGSPDLVRREGPARVWQYTTSGCVLDLYLFEAGVDFEVIHHAVRGRREGEPPEAGCYAELIERARVRSATTGAGATAAAQPVSPHF